MDATVFLVVPNILADRYPECASAKIHDSIRICRLKVPVFVEYVVGREQSFIATGHNFAAVDQRRRIEILLAGTLRVDVDVADDQRCLTNARGEFIQRTEIVVDKALLRE